MNRMRVGVALIIIACGALIGCESMVEGDTRHVRLTGTVRSAETGQPIAGGIVNLERIAFVFEAPVATDTTDINGQYRIEKEIRCKRDTDLYLAPGDAYLLVATAAGHENQSNINSSASLRCITTQQVVNFTLRIDELN